MQQRNNLEKTLPCAPSRSLFLYRYVLSLPFSFKLLIGGMQWRGSTEDKISLLKKCRIALERTKETWLNSKEQSSLVCSLDIMQKMQKIHLMHDRKLEQSLNAHSLCSGGWLHWRKKKVLNGNRSSNRYNLGSNTFAECATPYFLWSFEMSHYHF